MSARKHTTTAMLVAIAAMGIAGLTAAPAAATTNVLFADTFDRPDSTDLNASTNGKSGTLGALNYGEKLSGSADMAIAVNMLKGGDSSGGGGSWAIAYISDHNFVDADIARAGGFSISIDLKAYASAGSGRYMSVGVGQSLAELTGATNLHGKADLLVGYRWLTKSLEFFTNGVRSATNNIAAYPVPQVLRVEYAFTDFNAGSTVNYRAYLGTTGTNLIRSGSFVWSGTDENYISLHSNLSSLNARFDNFQITTQGYVPLTGVLLFVK